MTAQQTDATTDPQSIIAALQQRLDAGLAREAALAEALAARTAELAQRNTDYRERIEHQAATIDVLKVMSASPGDPEPVFDLIARQAAKLCEVPVAAVAMFDGTMIHLATQSGFDTAHAEMYVAQFPRPVGLDTTMGRAILNQRVEQVEDVAAEAGYTILQPPGPWSNMAVPLLRDGVPLGAIAVARPMTGAFSNSQIILLKTFAEQAVIAITSAETYRGLHEALEQQTATAEVLQVINAKPGDLAPVFDAMLEKALALCGSAFGTLNVFDGEMFHVVASRGLPAALANYFQKPITPAPGMTLHRVVLGEDIVHVADLRDDDAYRSRLPTRVALVDLGGARTQLIVSLRKDNRLIGVIMVYRTEVRSYTDKQIALLENFADQAVVAMENARLLGELRQRTADLQESLEYQTATSDVLKVISRSTFDLQPVLGTLVETAARLCAADFAMISNREGDGYREAATFSASPEWAASLHGRFLPENRGSVTGRAALERRAVQIADAASDSEYDLAGAVTVGETRSCVGVPLLREGIVVGVIALARRRVQPFTDKQIALVSTFADQAVIAIENVRLIAEQREALEQQTATAEVLQVINASPGNLTPVFDAILEKAVRLCQSAFGTLFTYDGQLIHFVAAYGITPEMMNLFREPRPPARGAPTGRIADGEPFVHVADATDQDIYRAGDRPTVAFVDQIGARTALFVGLRQDATLLGYLVIFRREVHAFSDKEIALVMNFAAQAVIAMENARLLTEQREALEQQTATAEVLQVINSSPGNLVPVFDAMLEKAMQLCEAAFGELGTYDGERFEVVALRGVPSPYAKYARGERKYGPGTGPALILEGERVVHVLDLKSTDVYAKGESARRAIVDLGGARTFLLVPLLKDENVVGFITIYRQEVRPFTEKQTSLLQSFAAQAVIAMDNARLLNEIRQRQSELRVTFDNMGDGVAMFDETPRLVAWNRKFQELLDVPDAILAERRTYADYIGYLTERGEFGADTDTETQLRRFQGHIREHYAFERTRPDGRVIEVRHNPVPDGGFVLIYTDITERKRSEAEIRAARDAAESAYRDLKAAQANLIQAEKMASLGQLTAGIAHEIKNPLNFVNNFAALSVDLLSELKETAAPGFAMLTDDQRADINDVSAMLTSNLEKITEHGKRADGIVKAMLEHSRGSSAERRMVDLNMLIDEALNLAYHGARAQDQSFNITLERDLGDGIAPIEVNPQDMTRGFLNIFSNGFYAATRRARNGGDAGFVPTLKVTTREVSEMVEIHVRDNGTGIPAEIMDKLFQPFFTTKPTGEGTGLGLSITYDIVTKQHGGTIEVDSEVGEFTEFVVTLPRQMFKNEGSRT